MELYEIQVKKAIKEWMKSQSKTQKDLADYLDVSYATVKRLLGKEELSLSRLIRICEWLGANLSDLDTYIKQNKVERYEFSEDQELFLISDLRYYLFLIKLYELSDVHLIAQRFNLNDHSLNMYLLRLEQNNLIRVTANGTVLPVHQSLPDWRPKGLMVKMYLHKLMEQFHQYFMSTYDPLTHSQDKSVSAQWITNSLIKLKKETYLEMQKEYNDFFAKWEKISDLESKITPDQCGYVPCVHYMCFTHDRSVDKLLDPVFGELTNLD